MAKKIPLRTQVRAAALAVFAPASRTAPQVQAPALKLRTRRRRRAVAPEQKFHVFNRAPSDVVLLRGPSERVGVGSLVLVDRRRSAWGNTSTRDRFVGVVESCNSRSVTVVALMGPGYRAALVAQRRIDESEGESPEVLNSLRDELTRNLSKNIMIEGRIGFLDRQGSSTFTGRAVTVGWMCVEAVSVVTVREHLGCSDEEGAEDVRRLLGRVWGQAAKARRRALYDEVMLERHRERTVADAQHPWRNVRVPFSVVMRRHYIYAGHRDQVALDRFVRERDNRREIGAEVARIAKIIDAVTWWPDTSEGCRLTQVTRYDYLQRFIDSPVIEKHQCSFDALMRLVARALSKKRGPVWFVGRGTSANPGMYHGFGTWVPTGFASSRGLDTQSFDLLNVSVDTSVDNTSGVVFSLILPMSYWAPEDSESSPDEWLGIVVDREVVCVSNPRTHNALFCSAQERHRINGRTYVTAPSSATNARRSRTVSIGGYHNSKVSQRLLLNPGRAMPKRNGDTMLGFELEVETVGADRDREKLAGEIVNAFRDEYRAYTGDNDTNAFFVERDGSLSDGFELITSYGSIDTMRRVAWGALAPDENGRRPSFLKNLRSHNTSTCGLHVHLDPPESLLTTARLVSFFSEPALCRLVKAVARRYNVNYARQNLPSTSEAFAYIKNEARYRRGDTGKFGLGEYRSLCELARRALTPSRYSAVNTTEARTVEVRIFRGTLNPITLVACLELSYCSWHYAHTGLPLTEEAFLEWLNMPEQRQHSVMLRAHLASRGFKVYQPKPKKVVALAQPTADADADADIDTDA